MTDQSVSQSVQSVQFSSVHFRSFGEAPDPRIVCSAGFAPTTEFPTKGDGHERKPISPSSKEFQGSPRNQASWSISRVTDLEGDRPISQSVSQSVQFSSVHFRSFGAPGFFLGNCQQLRGLSPRPLDFPQKATDMSGTRSLHRRRNSKDRPETKRRGAFRG